MSTQRKDSDFLNGVPELLLLRLLARRPMYGYELVQNIGLATSGVLEFGEGSIYPILHRLESDGLLSGAREKVGGRSRVVYRLTPAGEARLATSTSRWGAVVAAVNEALRGGCDATPELG